MATGKQSVVFCHSIPLENILRDFPGGPVAKTVLPMHGAWVPSLVRELDPTCHATTKTQCSQIKKLFFNFWKNSIND